VPAVIISAYTPQGKILNTTFDHTTVLSTVVNCFGLPTANLGARQAVAGDVSEALSLPAPRQDRPDIPLPGAATIGVATRASALGTAIVHANSKVLSGLQKKILVGAAKRLGMTRDQQKAIASVQTAFEADTELLKFEAQLAIKREIKHF